MAVFSFGDGKIVFLPILFGYHQSIAKEYEVRGVIIADEFDKRLIAAASEIPHVSLKRYKVNFTFEDVDKVNP